MVARAAVSSVTINRLLGFETYLPTPDNSKMIKAPAIDSTRPDGWETRAPSHSLLELPAEVAAQGYDCFEPFHAALAQRGARLSRRRARRL